MHNIALALNNKGFTVTGSDDAIFEPSKGRLEEVGLLPEKYGWFPEKITKEIDAIILGMHARIDNPELLYAQKLNIPIFSYPEYIYQQSINKKRIVIGGSHGKTTITAMILHVLNNLSIDFDYMVGAQLHGFKTMVRLTENAPIIIIEGDEYLSSSIDRRPKFHLYKPNIAVISGISWDHINVFPTFDIYIDQFRIFKKMVSDTLIYFSDDKELCKLIKEDNGCEVIPYSTPKHKIINGKTIIEKTELSVFGDHNLQNINAAKLVCMQLGVSKNTFFKEIASFQGAYKRLELIKETTSSAIYKDFAHSPSKLKATTSAMKKQYKERELVACMELHTFSSLNSKFLNEYKGCIDDPDQAIVYFNKEEIIRKKIKGITKKQVWNSFGRKDLIIFTNVDELKKYLKSLNWKKKNLLIMSSGNFNGIDFNNIID